MNNQSVVFVVGAVAVAGAVAIHVMQTPPLAHGAAGVDPSVSVEENCGGVAGLTRRNVLGTPDVPAIPGFREGSTLGVLVMGNDARNPQPDLVFHKPIPFPEDTVYGRNEEAFRKVEEAYFGEIEAACRNAQAANRSPVYELVKQGLAYLASPSVGCGPESHCFFLLKSDLAEDVHPELRAALELAAKDASAMTPPSLVASLVNSGIDVLICGTSEVKPTRAPTASPEARIRIWEPLFTDPERVTFQPYCNP